MEMKKEKVSNNVFDFKEQLAKFSELQCSDVLRKLRTDLDNGLDEDEVEYCHERYGYNEINSGPKNTWYKRLYESFINSFNIILFVIIGISFCTDYYFAAAGQKDLRSVIVISTMVFISGILGFIQNTKSDKASEELKSMINTTATVLRDGKKDEVPLVDVVPGDIIFLSAGSIIPADVRIMSAKDLFISQSSLTGESLPVEKFVDCNVMSDTSKLHSVIEARNLCFMGTNVISGSGICVVISIGNNTYFGSMAKDVLQKKVETNFDKGIKDIGAMLIKFVIIMALTVFFINGLFKHDWIQSFLFAISVAIGLTPEMLPVIVTTNLAKGATVMARKKTIVKNLSSIQNFGAMDILCTDKTGTLTQDKIVLEEHLNVHGEEDERVFKHAFLNSYYQTGLKNLLDIAVLEHIKMEGRNLDNVIERYSLIDEIPFDFVRKRMSVVLRDKSGKTQLITKGAVETMLNVCSFVEYKGKVEELTENLKREVLERMAVLNNKGMRVIGVAHKTQFDEQIENFSVNNEKNMVFIGFVAFLDPAKESSKDAIKLLNNFGVDVKVLTGDNDLVTKYICEKVCIKNTNILTGPEIENMSNDELKNKVDNIGIFAKLSPQQKSLVVTALRENGHVVGFMGDGINDAPAMKKADVAISVDTAVDIAKESADIILLEKDLKVLVNGVVEGRKIFGNIVKYIKMATSSNFGNMLSILIACAFIPFLPMLPLQILVLNLFYDISQTVIPWDNMDSEYLQKQKKWDIKSIKKFMFTIGPVSTIFDLTMFIILYFIFGCNDPTDQYKVAFFQTGWFVLSIITQTIIIHFIRTEKLPFIESIASKPVLIMTTSLIIVGLMTPFGEIGNYMKMVALPLTYFMWLFLIISGYIISILLVKKIYIKKYKNWL